MNRRQAITTCMSTAASVPLLMAATGPEQGGLIRDTSPEVIESNIDKVLEQDVYNQVVLTIHLMNSSSKNWMAQIVLEETSIKAEKAMEVLRPHLELIGQVDPKKRFWTTNHLCSLYFTLY